ncbi:MAG: hypothetical protein QOD07_2265 [Frankiaceae bacterium]|jgi:hypothetical protein|nr:hypothetical protein [Frankiaceae bacterium]
MNLVTRKAATVGVVAALGLTAGGVAWAEAGSAPVTAAAAGDSMAKLHGIGGRVLHGEFVVKTRNGFATIDVARGIVSAIDGNSVSVKSADGVVTTFAIGPKTKARSAGHAVALGTVHAGDRVGVMGLKNGSAVTARLIRELPAGATQDGATQDGVTG